MTGKRLASVSTAGRDSMENAGERHISTIQARTADAVAGSW